MHADEIVVVYMPEEELFGVCLLKTYIHCLSVLDRLGFLPDRCISLPDYDDVLKAMEN